MSAHDSNPHDLAAGPVLDRMVAHLVMGWDVDYRLPAGERPAHDGVAHFYDKSTRTLYLPEQWCPSSNPEQALQVLRHLQSEDWHLGADIRSSRGSPEDDPYWDVVLTGMYGDTGVSAGYDFPLALCRAALDLCHERREK